MPLNADQFFSTYIKRFLAENRAGRELAEDLKRCGVGLMPLVDPCAPTMSTAGRGKSWIWGSDRTTRSV